jgi:hypothetical protein
LWNRGTAERLHTEGDPAVLQQFNDVVQIR